MSRGRALPILLLLLILLPLAGEPAAATSPPSVAKLLEGSAFSEEDIAAVLAGEIAVTAVEHPSDREIAVGIACLVEGDADPMAPFDRPRPMLPSDGIEAFERLDPAAPKVAFEKLELAEADREELRRYIEFEHGVGLNLSPAEAESFEALVASDPDSFDPGATNAAVRRALTARFESYRKGGLAGIAPYAREGGQLIEPGRELDKIIDQAHVLRRLFPKFMEMWDAYPQGVPPEAEESYYWVRARVRDRPMLVLAHQVEWRDGTSRLQGERLFYASHFFNVGHTIAISTPTREGRLFSLVDRLWVDGYEGMSDVKQSLGERMLKRKLVEQVQQREVCISD